MSKITNSNIDKNTWQTTESNQSRNKGTSHSRLRIIWKSVEDCPGKHGVTSKMLECGAYWSKSWISYCSVSWPWNDRKDQARVVVYANSIVQFSSWWYLCARKTPYALHPVSRNIPQRCFWNSSDVCLTDDGPLSSFQVRSSSASSFRVFLLQAIDAVMSLALCPQVCLKLLNTLYIREASHLWELLCPPLYLFGNFQVSKQATCQGCFARQYICSVISRSARPQGSIVPTGKRIPNAHPYGALV